MRSVQDLACDPLTGNLYWSDSAKKWIMVSDSGFQYHALVYRTDRGYPSALVVDVKNR